MRASAVRPGTRDLKLPETLLTVQEIASHLRLKPSWVYEHADELGAYRLGKYLRFALPRVMERLERGGISCPEVGSAAQRPPSTSTKGDGSNGQGTD
jgi:hypothetical protein